MVVKTVGVVTVDEHVSTLLLTAHLPLLEVSVKPELEGEAVNDAHVPVVYHVPPLIMQPSAWPPVVTGKVPLPENGVPGGLVGPELEEDVVVVPVPVPEPLGRYLTPVAGQLLLLPSGFVATKVPVWTDPMTS